MVDIQRVTGISHDDLLRSSLVQEALELGTQGVQEGNDPRAVAMKAQDIVVLGTGEGQRISLDGQASIGSTQNTAPPKSVQSSNTPMAGRNYWVAMDANQTEVRVGGKQHGAYLTGAALTRVLDKTDPAQVSKDNPEGFVSPALRESIIKKHGLVKSPDGTWLRPGQPNEASTSALKSAVPGIENNPIASSAGKFMQRSSWLMPALGFLTGGVGGLAGGFLMSKTLKSVSGGLSGGDFAPGLAAAGLAGGGSYMSKLSGLGTYATGSMMAQAAGFKGLAFNMRSIMKSHVREMRGDSMAAQINNPGIPIEDLIFMFMAYMGEKYENKLREKMEEANMAEQKEERRARDDKQGRMLGGLVSAIPVVGQALGGVVEYGFAEKSRIRDALDGNTKSSTILMSEVQMLMQKWKQMNEMLSNLMKSLHEMAMTPIRNLR